MRTFAFSRRCAKEILRDPLNIMFGLGFPVVLLLLLSAIQANVPVELFSIEKLAPGIAVFGMSFLTLFSATLIAKDKESSFISRLYTTPLKSAEFILGYLLPLLPIALAQIAVCYVVAIFLGLPISVNILFAILGSIPIAILYISLGLLCGSAFNVKQVGGICGALLTNLSAWLSGIWFDLELVGGWFLRLANLLPFYHAVELERAIIGADTAAAFIHIFPVLGYAIAVTVCAVGVFLGRMETR